MFGEYWVTDLSYVVAICSGYQHAGSQNVSKLAASELAASELAATNPWLQSNVSASFLRGRWVRRVL